MSNIYLGRTFDIHGGGLDLIFPHHENERAQSICANGGQFARFWVHNGFVTVESEKMSKSLGNFITIRDAISQYHPEVLRLFLLSKHYRTPLDFSKEQVFREQNALLRIYRKLKRLEEIMGKHTMNLELEELFYNLQQVPGFLDSLSQDLNTPAAIAALFSAVKEVNGIMDGAKRQGDEASLRQLRDGILAAGKVLGILNQEPSQFLQEVAKSRQEIQEEEIERLIEERASARKAKDFKRADEIRDYLKSKGVILEDTPKGTKWRWDLS